jgi:hypothetical protein
MVVWGAKLYFSQKKKKLLHQCEHIQIINAENQMVDINYEMVHPFNDIRGQCYRLDNFSSSFMGQAFSFGGPGGFCP